MSKFTCDGFRAVQADTFAEAAAVFAKRIARKDYGSRGVATAVRQQNWRGGNSQTFQAYIGTPCNGGVNGGNQTFYVTRED